MLAHDAMAIYPVRLDRGKQVEVVIKTMAQLKKFVTSQKNGDFSDFIYLVCSGKGNERSNVNLGLQSQTTWRNSSITSGEKPITSEISNGGELLRVVEYQTTPGDIFQNARGTADFLRSNYGFIGRDFTEIVKEIGVAQVLIIYNEFVEQIRLKDIENEKEGKQINSLALMLTADKILTDYIIKDGVYIDFDECFNLVKSNKVMSDNERAYEFILNEVNMHIKKFSMSLEFEPEQRWGYLDGEYALINPNAFNGFCERGNFNKKMFIDWAVEKGFSQVNKGRIDKRVNNERYKGNFIFIKVKQEDIQPSLFDNCVALDPNAPTPFTNCEF